MASELAILDTGAILAFLSRRDRFHMWAVAAFKKLPANLITCEAVLSELFFLLKSYPPGAESVIQMLQGGSLKVLSLNQELDSITNLMRKYSDVPMSFADACLVRIAELSTRGIVVTLDSNFKTYRLKKNQKVSLMMPD